MPYGNRPPCLKSSGFGLVDRAAALCRCSPKELDPGRSQPRKLATSRPRERASEALGYELVDGLSPVAVWPDFIDVEHLLYIAVALLCKFERPEKRCGCSEVWTDAIYLVHEVLNANNTVLALQSGSASDHNHARQWDKATHQRFLDHLVIRYWDPFLVHFAKAPLSDECLNRLLAWFAEGDEGRHLQLQKSLQR